MWAPKERFIIKADNYYVVRERGVLFYIILTTLFLSTELYFYAHFKDEEIEVGRGQVTCPRLAS